MQCNYWKLPPTAGVGTQVKIPQALVVSETQPIMFPVQDHGIEVLTVPPNAV